MTIKRLLLIAMTLLAVGLSSISLSNSWQKPQFQSLLELYQTNIVLQAQAWQPEDSSESDIQNFRELILGDKPLDSAQQQYQQAQQSVQGNLEKTKQKLAQLHSPSTTIITTPKPLPEKSPATQISGQSQEKQLQKSLQQQEKLLAELNLRLGILQATAGETEKAISSWSQLSQTAEVDSQTELQATANVLTGIWSNPPRVLPNSQQLIQNNLAGWFRSTALIQLYQLQQRQDALTAVETERQETASAAILKLALIATIPSVTALIGSILLVFLLLQRLIKGKEAILAQNAELVWSTPWNGETVLQVFVFGFLLMGQLFIPELLTLLPLPRGTGNARIEAFSVFVSYLLVATGAVSVLYLSIKRYFPLPEQWFRFSLKGNWFLWGLGGYCTALPIVVIVSLINQQLWRGQGGSNPLLQLALESRDFVALGIFFFTAAIAAPLFEEFLFRGFLLPSLTRYIPVWAAILASSVLFAVAHLSLSEILPLTALGIVLGLVYTRSRNLLSSMLLHSLWNSGTLLSLFLLGSGNN
ncbi:CPBP family intramembrane glutamic endopeptidase [Richelia sinica]|nr:type II CAAX endopeptidase family protein [Richelia sinica]MBD2665259.1 CPBP family intramembrane metalloprotease [Richelia sinica FACHB-800]